MLSDLAIKVHGSTALAEAVQYRLFDLGFHWKGDDHADHRRDKRPAI